MNHKIPHSRSVVQRGIALLTAVGILFSQALFLHQPAIAAETERGRLYASLWQERRTSVKTKNTNTLLSWAAPSSGLLPPLERVADMARTPLAETPSPLRRFTHLPAWTRRLPLAWGEVQSVQMSGSGRPWAVLIEDLHQQEDAQRNIARMLEHFSSAVPTPLPVAIEGGSGPYDFSTFRQAGPPEAVRRAADHFLTKGWISGAQYAGLTSERAPVFSGAEDPALYEANIKAFLMARPCLPRAEAAIAASSRRVASEKARIFPPKAIELDAARTHFQSGTLPVKDYLHTLQTLSHAFPGGNLSRFLSLVQREETIRFDSVERERADLLRQLATRLGRAEVEQLTSLATAYRAGEISFGPFYRTLESMAQRNGQTIGPAFREYLNYLSEADALDRREFLDELSAYQDRAAKILLTSEPQRALWIQLSQLDLADKLIHQNLSAEEWEHYERMLDSAKGRPIVETLDIEILKPFENFYRTAMLRNDALAKGFHQAATSRYAKPESPAGVLVAGGFHTEGLTRALAQRGYNVLTLAPKINMLNGEHYMAAFTRDRSPLDRILLGEKLFLATPQTLGQAPANVPAAYRAEAAARSSYFLGLVQAFAQWAKGQTDVLLANGQSLKVCMGQRADLLASKLRGFVQIDQGEQLLVMAKRASALAVGLGLALAVVNAHWSGWNKQMDAIQFAADRGIQSFQAIRRNKKSKTDPTDLANLLRNNFNLRAEFMESLDLGSKEESYRLYDSLLSSAESLSEICRSSTEDQFAEAWRSFSPASEEKLVPEDLKKIRLELIEQGLREFPSDQKRLLEGLISRLAQGMFSDQSQRNEVVGKIKNAITPGHFSVVLSKKLLDYYFEVAQRFEATRDPTTANDLAAISKIIDESLDPLMTFNRLGSMIPGETGRLALKTYLTPYQIGHIFMHEAIHLGGYQGWLKIPFFAEHFPTANQILFLVQEHGVDNLKDPDLQSEMSFPVRKLFERGRQIGERGELGFLVLPGASGDNFNYFSNAPLLNEATGVLSLSGDNKDKLLDPYMAQRATGIVLAGVLAGRAAKDPNFQPLATMRGLYESLHERLGPPSEDEKRYVDETTRFLSGVAKGIAGASSVKMIPKPIGGAWTSKMSSGYSCEIHYVPSDLYPRGPGSILEEKERVRSRGLAHILWAVEGSRHERNDLRDQSPLLATNNFSPKVPAFHALWKALVFREMVAGLTDWRGRDVRNFDQMQDMAGAPQWMHELFRHRYHSGNEEYDRLLLGNLTSSEQFLDVLMYLRVHYRGGELSLSDPRLTNPRVHAALTESLGSMTEEKASGWGRVLFDDEFFNKDELHNAIIERIWPAFEKLLEQDIQRKILQKALAKMLQDRQQELNEQRREAFRQAIFENVENDELRELLNFILNLEKGEKEQLGNQAREEMNKRLEQFSNNMQSNLLGEESPEPSGEPEQERGGGQLGMGSGRQESSQGQSSPGTSPQGTKTRGAGSSSPSSPASLQEAIEELSQNLSALEKQLSDLGQKAQGLSDDARGIGSSAGAPDLASKAESLSEDGKAIQEGVHGLQQQGRDLAQGVNDARKTAGQDAAGLPATGSGKSISDALDVAGEQSDQLLGKLQEIQQKANDLAALAQRLSKTLGSEDATLPRDQAEALQNIAKELEKSLNEVGRQGPAHAIEKALAKAQAAVKELGQTLKSMPASTPPGTPSESGASAKETSEGESGTPTGAPGEPHSSGGARTGAVDLKPFVLDATPPSSSLWKETSQEPFPRGNHTPRTGEFTGFGPEDIVDIKTVFPGLTPEESDEYRQWRAPHQKLLEEVARVVPQLLRWTEGAEIRGGKYHGLLTDVVQALTIGLGRSMVEASKPLALKFTVLVDRSGSMGDEEKQKTVQFLLLVVAEIAFTLQKSVPHGAEYRDLFQFTIGFHDTEEEHLITHRTSSQFRRSGISKESVIYKLLKSAEAQGGTELAAHVEKYHADLAGFIPKGAQGESPARKILIVTSDMEVSDHQLDSLGATIANNVREKDPRRKVLTILVPTGNNEYAQQLKTSVGRAGIVLNAKPYKDLYRNILTVFAAGLDPNVSLNPETIARIGLEKMQRTLLPRAMTGWFGILYAPLIKRGWNRTAAVAAALLESGPAVLIGNLLGLGWISHFTYFVVIHLGKPLTEWARDANGARTLKQGTTPLTLRQWPLILLFGVLGATLHVWGVEFLLEILSSHLGSVLNSAEIVPYTKAGIAVILHAFYNLVTPGYLGMAGISKDMKSFGHYKNFFVRVRGGLEYLVYKDDIEELEWQRAPDPTRPGVSVPQEPMESIPDNEQTLKEILKKNFISGAVYMLKSEDGRRWFRPGSGSEMVYWEQDERDEWRQKETFSRGKKPQMTSMESDGRAHFANPEANLTWSWISQQPDTLLVRENGGFDTPVTGWKGDKPRTLELKKVSNDVILAFSADELKPALFRLVRRGNGWHVDESFLLDFKERRENFMGLIGPTGVGKEKFLKALGQLMNLPVDILSGHDKLQADELLYDTHIGRPDPGRQTEAPSVIARALYHGGIGVLDEEKMVRTVPKDALLSVLANGTIVIDRDAKPVFQSPWGRFMTTANYDQENIGTATTGEKAIAWQSRHELVPIAPARPEQEMMWQIGKAESRIRRELSDDLQRTIDELVKVATVLRLKVWGFHPTKQIPTMTKSEGGVSTQWRRCLLGEGGDRLVPNLGASDRLSRGPSPRVVEHMVQHFAAFPMDFAHRKWSVVRRYFNYDADDAPPGQYESQVEVSFQRKGFVDDKPGEAPPLTARSFAYTLKDGRHFLKLTPLTPSGKPDPRWDPVELEIFEGSWIFSGAFDSGMERWIELPENRLRLYKALQGWSLGLPLLFVGEPSSGKSRMAELLQSLVGGESQQHTVNKETMPHNLFYNTIMGAKGEPAFVTAQKPLSILKAGLKGGSCLIDEAHLLSQTMQGAFNNALSSGYYNLDGVLYRMPYLIFSLNEPDENYSALNAAFEERMDSQRFLPLPPEKVKAQTAIPEISGELFNDRLIGEKETDDQGKVVQQPDGQPHFLGLLGVMDYIRHHPEDFPRLLYVREFNRLVPNLAYNEARGLETALLHVSQGQTPWRLPQRRLFEIIRGGCRWPEGTPDQLAQWETALKQAMADAGLWNDDAETDPSKDGLLAFLNGEGLFIKDYHIVHTPDLGDPTLRPVLDGLLFLQRRTRGTRVQSEISRLWDHLKSIESRWESLPFSDRMKEVHVLREIHTTLGKIVDARRGHHLQETIKELERFQAGIRNFLFLPEVGWPSAALDPTLQREPWLNRHSLPTPGHFKLDGLLGKVQVFPADSENSPLWIRQASDILLDAAHKGTILLQKSQSKSGIKKLPELAETYLVPLAALEQSLRKAADAVPGLADTVAQLQKDIRSAIDERRKHADVIGELVYRLTELKDSAKKLLSGTGFGGTPPADGVLPEEWTRETLFEEVDRYINSSPWRKREGFQLVRKTNLQGRFVLEWKDENRTPSIYSSPFSRLEIDLFGNGQRKDKRFSSTGELTGDPKNFESISRWAKIQMIKILIREGKVRVSDKPEYKLETWFEPIVNSECTKAMVPNLRSDGKLDLLVVDLKKDVRPDKLIVKKWIPDIVIPEGTTIIPGTLFFLEKLPGLKSNNPSQIAAYLRDSDTGQNKLADLFLEEKEDGNKFFFQELTLFPAWDDANGTPLSSFRWPQGLIFVAIKDGGPVIYSLKTQKINGKIVHEWEPKELAEILEMYKQGNLPFWIWEEISQYIFRFHSNSVAQTPVPGDVAKVGNPDIPAAWLQSAQSLAQDIAGALERALGAFPPIVSGGKLSAIERDLKKQKNALAKLLKTCEKLIENALIPRDLTNSVEIPSPVQTWESLAEKLKELVESESPKNPNFRISFEIFRGGPGPIEFKIKDDDIGVIYSGTSPRGAIKEFGDYLFNMFRTPRNRLTGEFVNADTARIEEKLIWFQKEMIKILIREAKVEVIKKPSYQWGDISNIEIGPDGDHAVLVNQRTASDRDIVIIPLSGMSVSGMRAFVLSKNITNKMLNDLERVIHVSIREPDNQSNLDDLIVVGSPRKKEDGTGWAMDIRTSKLGRGNVLIGDFESSPPIDWKEEWGAPQKAFMLAGGDLFVSLGNHGETQIFCRRTGEIDLVERTILELVEPANKEWVPSWVINELVDMMPRPQTKKSTGLGAANTSPAQETSGGSLKRNSDLPPNSLDPFPVKTMADIDVRLVQFLEKLNLSQNDYFAWRKDNPVPNSLPHSDLLFGLSVDPMLAKWNQDARSILTGEFENPLNASIEAEIHHLMREELKILIQVKRVNVANEPQYQWGEVSNPDISVDGTHAVVLHQKPDGKSEAVMFDLGTMTLDGISAHVIPIPNGCQAVFFDQIVGKNQLVIFCKGKSGNVILNYILLGDTFFAVGTANSISTTAWQNPQIRDWVPVAIHAWEDRWGASYLFIRQTDEGKLIPMVLLNEFVHGKHEIIWREWNREMLRSTPSEELYQEIPLYVRAMIEEALAFNEKTGLGAANTSPAQAPPLGEIISSILSVLGAGLQPLVDIQSLHGFLSGPSASGEEPPAPLKELLDTLIARPLTPPEVLRLLEEVLKAVNQVVEHEEAPPAPDVPLPIPTVARSSNLTMEELHKRNVDFVDQFRKDHPEWVPLNNSQLIIDEDAGRDKCLVVHRLLAGNMIFDLVEGAFNGLDAFCSMAFGNEWKSGERNPMTGELKDPIHAIFEAEIKRAARDQLLIHIRNGNVGVDGRSVYKWGTVTNPDISPDLKHAVLVNRLPGGKSEAILFDLNWLNAHNARARIIPSLDPSLGAGFNNLNQTTSRAGIFLLYVSQESKVVSATLTNKNDLNVDYHDFRDLSGTVLKNLQFIEVHSWPTGILLIGQRDDGTKIAGVWQPAELGGVSAFFHVTSEVELTQFPNMPVWAKDMIREALGLPAPSSTTGPAQAVATRAGWVSLQNRAQRWFGGAVPSWLSGSMAEALYTALREMGGYWGIFLIAGWFVGGGIPPAAAFFLAVMAFLVNVMRFGPDHPNRGKDLGWWFPLTWNLVYASVVFSFALGQPVLWGLTMVVANLLRHVLYDAEKFATRKDLLDSSLGELEGLVGKEIRLPGIGEEIRIVKNKFEPQVVQISNEDVAFGASVLRSAFNSESVPPSSVNQGMTLIGRRLLGVKGQKRQELFSRYEGGLAVLASGAAQNSSTSAAVPWAKALAPVFALRKALGLENSPTGAVLGLLFRQLVQSRLNNQEGLLKEKELPNFSHPVLLDVSLLLDGSSENKALRGKLMERMEEILRQKNIPIIVTANRGTLEQLRDEWERLKIPEPKNLIFIDPSRVAENGLIDGVVLSDLLYWNFRGLFPEVKSSGDIRFNLITDSFDRFVGLSPEQIMNLLIITLYGLIQIKRQEIDSIMKAARAASTNA